MSRISIYEIRFASGQVYIGQTSKSIYTRLSGHKHNARRGHNTNRRMRELFERGTQHYIVEVASAEDAIEADRIETDRIHDAVMRLGADCLNRQAGPLKGTLNGNEIRERAKQSSRLLRCSACRQYKSWFEFNVDNNRSSGFHSRCKKCTAFIHSCYQVMGNSKKGYALYRKIFDIDRDRSRAGEEEYLSLCEARRLTPSPAEPPSGGGRLPRKKSRGNITTPPELSDPKKLRELFVVQRLSPEEIGRKVGRSRQVVVSYLKFHGFRKQAGRFWSKKDRDRHLAAIRGPRRRKTDSMAELGT